MSIEERFDQLLIDNIKYWKVDEYDVDGYNDNELSSYLRLNHNQDGKKQTFFLNFTDIWSVLETEYSLDYQQIKDFTSSRLEQAYNFMDVTTKNITYKNVLTLEQAYNFMDVITLSYNNLYKY